MQKKTVAVITGTRAEYGLLRGVMEKIRQSEFLSLKLLVTGAHLSEKYGSTVNEIVNDGFEISEKFDILKFENNRLGTIQSCALCMNLFGEWFVKNKPDACLVLGDRYEIFSAGAAAVMAGVPLIHISGGDVTLGAADEWYRHSLTKMASLHFPSCEEYAARIIRMGEEPQRVYNVGGLGDENIRKLKLLSKDEISEFIGFNADEKYCLVTYHPETAANSSPKKSFENLLSALKNFPNVRFIFTKANADAGGDEINKLIDECTAKNKNCTAYTSMGVLRYLSAMKYCRAVIGNSSSGVVETPTFGKPCVNIGDRQKGRIICQNVICCETDEKSIAEATKKALSDDFYKRAETTQSPYNGGDTSEKIVRIIAEFLNSDLPHTVKTFYDGDNDNETDGI